MYLLHAVVVAGTLQVSIISKWPSCRLEKLTMTIIQQTAIIIIIIIIIIITFQRFNSVLLHDSFIKDGPDQ